MNASFGSQSGWKGRAPKWPLTPEIEGRVRSVFRSSTGDGEVRELARQINVPRWRVSRWALELGLRERLRKEPPWSEDELRILERHTHLCPQRIKDRLRKAGFDRSENGIILKKKRMRFRPSDNGYTANALAGCFGVDPKTITRWIIAGHLKAERRGTARQEIQGGDMWWMKEKDIQNFIVENVALIDIRKVDKFWLVDILT